MIPNEKATDPVKASTEDVTPDKGAGMAHIHNFNSMRDLQTSRTVVFQKRDFHPISAHPYVSL